LFIIKYFFDDYLSDAIQERVERAGYHYLDMGREIEGLDDSFQFYTDYCHLTVDANEFIAKRMGDFILPRLPQL
jgi:hypothetical protein